MCTSYTSLLSFHSLCSGDHHSTTQTTTDTTRKTPRKQELDSQDSTKFLGKPMNCRVQIHLSFLNSGGNVLYGYKATFSDIHMSILNQRKYLWAVKRDPDVERRFTTYGGTLDFERDISLSEASVLLIEIPIKTHEEEGCNEVMHTFQIIVSTDIMRNQGQVIDFIERISDHVNVSFMINFEPIKGRYH